MDDLEEVLDILSIMLGSLGHTVIQSTSGEEAFQKYLNIKDIDVVITDIVVDGNHKDGYWLLNELRKANPKLRVIVMSGYSNPEATSKFLVDGFDDVLCKPYTKIDLKNILGEQ